MKPAIIKSLFKVGQEVSLRHHVPGCPLAVGEVAIVTSVTNKGTKRNPEFRYSVSGGYWLYEDAIQAV